MPLIPALERIIKREETALRHSLSLRFLEAGLPFWTEVEVRVRGWLFCFSDLQVELLDSEIICLWIFINHSTS